MPYDKYGRWYAGPSNMVEQNPSNQFLPSSGMPMQLSQQQVQQRNAYRQNMNSFAGQQQIQNQQNVADLRNYQNSLASTETTLPVKRGTLNQSQPEVEEEKKGGMSAAQGIAAGAGMIGTLAQTIQPSTYDRRTGLEKKGTFASLYGDNTAFKVGASTGNPIAMVGGLIVDRVKNAMMMQHERKQGKEELSRYNLMAGINKNQMMAQPNYIGYAKNGMKSKGQLANLEQDEIAIKLGKDGKYKHIITTGPDHPSHDIGGKNYFLEQGTLVFPKKYKSKVENALAKGDTKIINELKTEMLVESTSRALRGDPYSNQSGIETQLQELSQGKNVVTARYGAKINKDMKTKYYNYGGMVGQNPYIDQAIPQGGANPYFSAPQQNFQMPQIPNQIPAQTFENGGVSGFGDPPPDLIPNFAEVQVDNTGMQNEQLPMYFWKEETENRQNYKNRINEASNPESRRILQDQQNLVDQTIKLDRQSEILKQKNKRPFQSTFEFMGGYRYGGQVPQYKKGGQSGQWPPPGFGPASLQMMMQQMPNIRKVNEEVDRDMNYIKEQKSREYHDTYKEYPPFNNRAFDEGVNPSVRPYMQKQWDEEKKKMDEKSYDDWTPEEREKYTDKPDWYIDNKSPTWMKEVIQQEQDKGRRRIIPGKIYRPIGVPQNAPLMRYGGKIPQYATGGMVGPKDPPKKKGLYDVRYHNRDQKFLERQMKRSKRQDKKMGKTYLGWHEREDKYKNVNQQDYYKQTDGWGSSMFRQSGRPSTFSQDRLNDNVIMPGMRNVFSKDVYNNTIYKSKTQTTADKYNTVPFVEYGSDPRNQKNISQIYDKQGLPNFSINENVDESFVPTIMGSVNFQRLSPAQKKEIRQKNKPQWKSHTYKKPPSDLGWRNRDKSGNPKGVIEGDFDADYLYGDPNSIDVTGNDDRVDYIKYYGEKGNRSVGDPKKYFEDNISVQSGNYDDKPIPMRKKDGSMKFKMNGWETKMTTKRKGGAYKGKMIKKNEKLPKSVDDRTKYDKWLKKRGAENKGRGGIKTNK